MQLNLYLVVQNMDRAVDFYQGLFQKPPLMRSESYTTFDLNGALWGLFNAQHYPVPVQQGGQVVPNLLVSDIDAEHTRVAALNPAFITDIRANGPYRLFVISDPEGTPIELYAHAGA
ncbi:MAG: hypothetical protein SF162_19780 [bacterium]|nr:hypothetical protein [bacterium]